MSTIFVAMVARYSSISQRMRVFIAMLWYMIITMISHIPGSSSSSTARWFTEQGWVDWNMVFRFSAHCGVFGLLALFVYSAMQTQLRYSLKAWSISVVLTALGGLCDEIHQGFVPGRFFKWSDVALDTIAGAIAILVLCAIVRKYGRQHTDSTTMTTSLEGV